jgi:CheY-like chemotaxis protein
MKDNLVTAAAYPLLNGLQALVVDDEDDSLSLITFVLAMYGVRVMAVGSARAALEALKKTQPDFLVCDAAMPFENGYSLIRHIRALEGLEKELVPAIALSALPFVDHLQCTRPESLPEEEFQAYLIKPVEPEDLVATVLSFVRQPQPKSGLKIEDRILGLSD